MTTLTVLFLLATTAAGQSLNFGPCSESACDNGGICRQISGSSPLHWCMCDSAHRGLRCEQQRCETSCINGGRCTENNGVFTCKCPRGFTGDACEIALPSTCTRKRPCGNRGVCRLLDTVEYGSVDYTCDCKDGWTGPDCRLRETSCDGATGRLCQNGGRCVQSGGRMTCRCPKGFVGEHCEERTDICDLERPCKNGAQCMNTSWGGFYCECAPGYTGERCEVPSTVVSCSSDPTSPEACQNNGYCNANGLCDCTQFWTGQRCERDIDECEQRHCKNGGTCSNSYGGYTCFCPFGYDGDDCENNIDDCVNNACAAGSRCVDGISSYTCECANGFQGTFCNVTSACREDLCVHGPCYSSESGEYTCVCDSGWTGEHCDIDVDECAESPCSEGASCLNTKGSFECLCPEGKSGPLCELSTIGCTKHNDCYNGGHCRADGVCACADEWEGPNCELAKRDWCKHNSCQSGEICVRNASELLGYSCTCPPGYGGRNCAIRVASSCTANPCQHGGSCADLLLGFRCTCPSGYTGTNCEIAINHCTTNPCENGGSCLNEVDGFVCHCDIAHYGRTCENTRDPCAGNLCDNGALCKPTSNFRNYTCECARGFTGPNCEQDVNECERAPCLNGGQCANNHGGYACICPVGYEGKHCAKNTDDCANEPCLNNGTCVDGVADFTCVCKPGFSGKMCAINVDDCASNPCQSGGICRDGINSYTCDCRKGFSGRDCQINDDDCRPGLCLNGGRCVDGVADYHCECERGFFGKNCQKWADVDRFNVTDEVDKAACDREGCSSIAGDGVCNQQCNHFACDFDGGDCSASTVPFSRCASASFCAHVFADGKCDEVCNSENCLFDGFDCDGGRACPVTRKAYCRDHAGDGTCDEMCDSAECGWDGGDCGAHRLNHTMTDITLIVLVRPRTFVARVDDLLTAISERLRTSVRVKKDEHGAMEVFQWSAANGQGARVAFGTRREVSVDAPRSRRASDDELSGVLVVIQVNLAECTKECFSDAAAVAMFIGAAEAKKAFAETGMAIHSAVIARPGEMNGQATDSVVLIVVVAVIAIALAALGMIALGTKRRLIIDAPIWKPPCKEARESFHTNFYNQLGHSGYQNWGTDNSSKINTNPVFKQIKPEEEPIPFTALEMAASGDEPITDELRSCLGLGGRHQRTAMHWLALNAIKKSDQLLADLETLRSFGIDVNTQDCDGNTALHYACRNARYGLVRKLLEYGADPMIDNEVDMNALHEAATHFDDKAIEYLLAHEAFKDTANLEAIDLYDRTALMLYAANSTQSIKGAQLLIEAGADVNYSGDKKRSYRYRGRTALHHAAASNRDNREMIVYLVGKNANKDAQDVAEATPLWLAVDANNFTAVDKLLESGASLDFADQKERTPEILALEKGYKEISERLKVARQRCPSIGMIPSYNIMAQRMQIPPPSTKIAPPKVKRPLIKKPKSPTTPPASTSGYSTTPSPPGLKSAVGVVQGMVAGPSCMDSPNSDHQGGRHSVGGGANSSSEFGSPGYTPAYATNPMLGAPQPSVGFMRPSPPYDYPQPGMQQPGHFPSLSLPPLSQQPTSSSTYETYQSFNPYAPYHETNYQPPPSCAYQQQETHHSF